MWNMIDRSRGCGKVADSFERHCTQNEGPTGFDENFQLFNAKFLLANFAKFVTLSDWFIIKSNGPSCVDYTSPYCLAI